MLLIKGIVNLVIFIKIILQMKSKNHFYIAYELYAFTIVQSFAKFNNRTYLKRNISIFH